jgi:hypothetical protein
LATGAAAGTLFAALAAILERGRPLALLPVARVTTIGAASGGAAFAVVRATVSLFRDSGNTGSGALALALGISIALGAGSAYLALAFAQTGPGAQGEATAAPDAAGPRM